MEPQVVDSTIDAVCEDRRSADETGSGSCPRGRARSAAIVVGVAALIPRLATVGHFFNLDEVLWMSRSMAFSDALIDLDPSKMSAIKPLTGTMPGIPTVWLGSLARLVWNLGTAIGLVDPGQHFAESASGFATAQAMVACATAVLIGLFVWLVAKWLSTRVAVVAGMVFATEPLWVSLGSILHTDELVALFGLNGLVALSWALGLPDADRVPAKQRRWMVVAAFLLVCAPLTKVSGLVFGAPAIGMVVWALVRAVRGRPEDASFGRAVRPMLDGVALMVLVGAVVTVVSYPALLWNWPAQWHALQGQFRTAGGDRHVFYRGSYAAHPGIDFYPVTLAYTASAWVFVLAPVGVVVALARRATRRVAIVALSWAVVPAVSLLRSGLVYTRYGLVVLGPATLAAACAVHPRSETVGWWTERVNRIVAGAAALALVAAVVVAPWSGLAFNPILSAVRKPVLVLPLGWGESDAAALPVIERDVRAVGLGCPDVSVAGLGDGPVAGTCQPRRETTRSDADYVVVAASTRQRFSWTLSDLPERFDLLDVVSIEGQRIVEVWRSEDFTRRHESKSAGTS